MAASYPTATKSFSTKTNGSAIAASHVDDLQDEVVAIEADLRAGLPAARGGTGATTLSAHGVLIGNGTSAVAVTGAGTAGQALLSNGASADPTFQTVFAAVLQDFRLSLTTALSVTTADVTAATTLYFTPHAGRRCTIFDGSGNATTLTSAELSIAVPATTSQLYDVFVYSNGGVLTLELLAWTNDTTRATAIVKTGAIDAAGVWTKSGDPTRRYVGSFRTTTVSGQTEDSVTKRYLWNYYNRVPRELRRQETTGSWNYTTATWRQANTAAANQVDIVLGVAEVNLQLSVSVPFANTNANVNAAISIGEDSTTTPLDTGIGGEGSSPAASATAFNQLLYTLTRYPAVGRHFYTWLEISVATGTTTFVGAGGFANGVHVGGMIGWLQG